MSNTLGMSLEDIASRLSTLEAHYGVLVSRMAGIEMQRRRIEAQADDAEEEMQILRLALVSITKAKENIAQ